MKQTHLVAKKEWDILFVLDTFGDFDSFVEAAAEEGIVGDLVDTINKFPRRDLWFERNFWQFLDGRNKDVTLIGVDPALWKPATLWLMEGVFGDTVRSWESRRKDKNAQAIKDAEKLWNKASFTGKIVVQLSGGVGVLPSLALFVQSIEARVAITAIAGGNPVPWIWAYAGPFLGEVEKEAVEEAVEEYELETAETEAAIVDVDYSVEPSIVDYTNAEDVEES